MEPKVKNTAGISDKFQQKVPIIVGPTCSGKTGLSLILARKLNSEIISADSRQIYKYIDIGTAKPSPVELKTIKHYFVNELEPDEDFNVSRFETDALLIIKNILSRNKVPVVIGGTGLYIRALVDGIFNSVDTDEEFRSELLKKKNEFGNEYLFDELKRIDPESAAKMLPQNWKRIIRALEVFHLTGKTIGRLQAEYKREIKFNFDQYGLEWDRDILYQNIERRVDEMIDAGLVDEVKSLLNRGYNKNLNSLNTVGYKEIISFLKGDISLGNAVELIKRNTRRYAKRQLTWFKADDRIKWFKINSEDDFGLLSEKIISNIIHRD